MIEQARQHSTEIRVFSFGLGSGCDEYLVNEVARAGRGSSTLVRDGGDELKACVIRSLSNAMEPSLFGVQYGWDGLLEKDHELYRNQLIYQTRIMSKQAFESVRYDFNSKADPKTGESI